MQFSALCPARVCKALMAKYANDPRHRMVGFVWKHGNWIKVAEKDNRQTATHESRVFDNRK